MKFSLLNVYMSLIYILNLTIDTELMLLKLKFTMKILWSHTVIILGENPT